MSRIREAHEPPRFELLRDCLRNRQPRRRIEALDRIRSAVRIQAGGTEAGGMGRMTCREVNEFLADYASGDLLPEVRARFEAHLLECPHCVSYARSYGRVVRLARESSDGGVPDLLPDDVPEDLVAAILDCTVRRAAPGRTS